MKVLVTGEEMRALDQYSIEVMGVPSLVLMERAALAVFEEIEKRVPGSKKLLIFAGTGNNGADGLALARMFAQAGSSPRVVITGNRAHATPEWQRQFDICEKMEIPMTSQIPDLRSLRDEGDKVIVDAMLGTGLSRPVSDKISDICDLIRASGCYAVSIDIPSGISADKGGVMGAAVRADLTVTFQYTKLGLVLYPGGEYAGEVVTRDIGIFKIKDEAVRAYTLTREDLSSLPARPAWSNKGTFGHVLVIAGSRNMAGAACLAAEAAYRSGAGLVMVLTPECNRLILQQRLPEAILTTYPDEEMPETLSPELAGWASSIVIGPGIGRDSRAASLLLSVLSFKDIPLVVDADALNLLAACPERKEYLHENCILTPHLGEMSRLTGSTIAEIRSDLMKSAADFVSAYPVTLVQKDARTLVMPADGSACFVNSCGNSGMATGGSGDVLSGVIGGLLAAGLAPAKAAVMGVLMHALAGDDAEGEKSQRSLLAGDILAHLR